MKSYIYSLNGEKSAHVESKSNTPLLKKPIICALTVASPLRESLPQNMSANTALTPRKKSPLIRPGMTPMTNALYAFGESPGRALDQINNTLASKRIINFDDNSQEPAAVKKQRFANPIMGKILEHKLEDSQDSQKRSNYHLYPTIHY